MSKWSKIRKKLLAGILVTAMVTAYLPQARNAAQAAETDAAFDENNVVLKLGVMSDIHLSYGHDSASTIKAKVENYAKAVGTLNAMSGNDLDVLMLAGDYTSYGMYEQGKTFATASKAIMDAINKDKSENDKTQFFFTYGNHDTEWTGQMSYAEWEDVLNESQLLDGLTKGPENAGCYKYTRTVNGRTYYFFSVETETYNNPSNTFRVDVLEWLDQELAKTPKDAYVYVVSHGPIKETGVYGSDVEYNKNADWGTAEAGYSGSVTRDNATYKTSSDIDGVLKKYPQVVYFSGHTHFTNKLESTIMSDMYTAITVSQFTYGDLYSSVSNFLDTSGGGDKPGYSLYIEVDGNGNQRITRVGTSDYSMIASVTVNGTLQEKVADNPTSDSATIPKIDAYYTDSVEITYNESGKAATLTPWVMQAPNANGDHLKAYSAETRKEIPVFNAGDLVLDEVANNSGESLTVKFTFPTAKCDNSYVFRYEFTLYDEDGKAVDTQWILGNWTNNTDGVTETGKTHLDATTLSYEKTYTNAQLAGVSKISATLTAVNEFGGRTMIGDKTSLTSVGIMKPMKPSAVDANKNMFDGLTADRVYAYTNQDKVTAAFDEKGNATIEFAPTTNDEIVFDIAESKSELAKNWGWVTRYGSQLTDIHVEDTFVYQTDFSVQQNGGIYFTFRATEANDNHWKCDYSGIVVDGSGTALFLNQRELVKSDAFKLTDAENHTLTIVSAPTTVSVWIDDTLIFDNEDYDVTKDVAENGEGFSGDGTAENPYKHNGISLKNTDMVPVLGFYAYNASVFTVSNQYVYLYDQKEQVRNDWKATEINYYDSDMVTVSAGNQFTSVTKTTDGFTVDATATNNDYNINYMEQDLSSEFDVKDTVITEFEYTPTSMTSTDASQWNEIVAIAINFRSNGETNGTARLLIRVNGAQNLFHFVDGTHVSMTTSNHVQEGQKVHVKIIHDNEKATVYLNDKLVLENQYYNQVPNNAGIHTENMAPIFNIGLLNANWKIENIVIRKADGSGVLKDVTAATEENNLLNGTYGEITSSFKNNSWEGKSDSVVSGNNFYTDLTWKNLQANGAESYWMGEMFYPFGTSNSNIGFKGNESFVMSALVRVSNEKLSDGTNTYNHRVGMQVADYNGKLLWYFIDTTTLSVLITENGVTSFIASIDLNTQIGYNVGDYLRLTTSITPFGFDIYTDGLKVYSYATGNGTNVSYAVTSWAANGVEACFLDASVHYNYANVELYKNQLTSNINAFETTKGVYFENADDVKVTAAEIKAVCETATSSEELWKYVGIMEAAIAQSGKVVNNMVLDGTTNIGTEETVDTPYSAGNTWHNTNLYIYKDAAAAPDLQDGDVWIFEADVKASDACSRIGFSLSTTEGHVMVQGATMYYNGITNADGTKKNGWEAGNLGQAQCAFESGKWHIKYTVAWGSKIVTELTNEKGVMITYEAPWNNINNLPEATAFYPSIYFVNTVAELSNIYVGYDLSADVEALDTAVEDANKKDLSSYTWDSAETFRNVLDNIKQMNTEITEYVNDAAGTIYTTPYTRIEINNAATKLAETMDKLQTADGFVSIGQEGTGNGVVKIGVVNGSTLPTTYLDDKYYITGWTLDNAKVTTVTDIAKAAEYVAEYIDLSMLEVKYQDKQNNEDANKLDIRFIASVDHLRYKAAGLVFSVSNHNPEISQTGCVTKEITTVYDSLYANSRKETADSIYNNNYSKFLYAWEYTGIPATATMYARAFVKLSDGTVIYGSSRAIPDSTAQ